MGAKRGAEPGDSLVGMVGDRPTLEPTVAEGAESESCERGDEGIPSLNGIDSITLSSPI